jgi:hypothetical protein
MTATHELVVPRSMPITLAMFFPSLRAAGLWPSEKAPFSLPPTNKNGGKEPKSSYRS